MSIKKNQQVSKYFKKEDLKIFLDTLDSFYGISTQSNAQLRYLAQISRHFRA